MSTDVPSYGLWSRAPPRASRKRAASSRKVEEKDADIAEVETVDGSLVQRYAVDRYTGRMQHSQ